MKLLKISVQIIIILNLSSCMFLRGWVRVASPMQEFQEELENASPDFRLGWYHGCEVGSYGGSNDFYELFHDNTKQDGFKMATSPEYATAWNFAWWLCYRSDYVHQKNSPWSSLFGGYK